MNTQYPMSYADFWQHAGHLIHNAELLTSRLIEQREGREPKKSSRRLGGQYKAPGNFKAFDEGLPVKLVDVLGMSPGHVFNQIKDQ